MVKTYCLDTNVLLSDPESIYAFQEHDVIIPMAVLEELDRHKSRPDEVGKNARQVSRTLDGMRSKGNSLTKGVQLPGGGLLRIASIDEFVLNSMPTELRVQKVDNLIIAFMYQMVNATKDQADKDNLVLVSRDINVRIKCDSLDLKCEDYRNIRIVSDQEKLYRGVAVIEVEESVVDEFYANEAVTIPESAMEGKPRLHPNQIVVIKHKNESGGQTKSALAKYLNDKSPLIPIQKIESAFGLKPRNKEQTFSLDLLYDEDIKLLTLVGPAGTGKTVIALAAALDQLRTLGSSPRYNKLIVMRTVQPVGKDIGFLPGTLQEKMEPWIAPVRDNLNFLMENKHPRRKRQGGDQHDRPRRMKDDGTYLSLMQENGLIEIEAITYIRGRSIPNAFIIIDEAQNLSVHELKTLITRVGEGTKIVLTGDIQQIDNVHVDVYTNGLTYAVERFKDHAVAGHVTLIKGERSPLATLASQIL